MSRQEIDAYFAQIPVWMKTDIRREINLALATEGAHRQLLIDLGIAGGGNLLAALGLVSYTEALGLIRLWNRGQRSASTEQCFLAFFDEMEGGTYGRWRSAWEDTHPETTIYAALRCGLVHEYRPKVNSEFWIAPGAPFGLADVGGVLRFMIEPYYRHFSAEVDRLYDELQQNPGAEIPPPQPTRRSKRAAPAEGIPPLGSPTTAPTSGPIV